MKATYRVKGMACEGCVKSVFNAIAEKLPSVRANVNVKEASVTVHGAHDPRVVEQAVLDAGFEFGGLV